MMTNVADVGGFEQHALGQFALDSQAELIDVGVFQGWIDGANASLKPRVVRRTCADVAEVGEVELHVLKEWLDVDLAEGDVAFSAVVEDSVAATDGGLIP